MAEIKVTGLKEFIAKIDDKSSVESALNIGVKKVVFFVQSEALLLTPVDKGFLWKSRIRSFKNLEGKLYNFRKYAIFVHEGTKFMKGNPFLQKTVKKTEKEANIIMNEELEKYLEILK